MGKADLLAGARGVGLFSVGEVREGISGRGHNVGKGVVVWKLGGMGGWQRDFPRGTVAGKGGRNHLGMA